MLILKESSVLDKQTAGVQDLSKADLRRENKTMKKRMLVIAAAVAATTMMMTSPVMAEDFKVGICNY